jgi:hypothetical protein
MIYATDAKWPMAPGEARPSFGQRCGDTLARALAYLAVSAAAFVAIGGVALGALGS